MRLQILTLLCSLFALVLATGKLEDKADVEDLLNAFNLIIDGKKYDRLHEIFTPDIVYYPGPFKDGRPVRGLPTIINIAKGIPATFDSYSHLGTKLITLVPPFDKEGRSNRAEAVSYNVDTFFSGAGNSTADSLILFIKYVDKEIIRTKDPGFGGWRIKSRSLELIVSYDTSRNNFCRGPPPPSLPSFHLLFHRAFTQQRCWSKYSFKGKPIGNPAILEEILAGEQWFEHVAGVTGSNKWMYRIGLTFLLRRMSVLCLAISFTKKDRR